MIYWFKNDPHVPDTEWYNKSKRWWDYEAVPISETVLLIIFVVFSWMALQCKKNFPKNEWAILDLFYMKGYHRACDSLD